MLQNLSKEKKKDVNIWLNEQTKIASKYIKTTVLIAFISSLFLIWQMYLISYMTYETFIKETKFYDLLNSFYLLLIVAIIRAFLNALKEKISFESSAIVKKNIYKKIINHISGLGAINNSREGSGKLSTATTENIEGLHKFLVYYKPQMYLSVLIPASILCFIFPISITSGVLFLISAPLIPFFMILVGLGASSLQEKYFKSLLIMNNHFLDRIQGLVTLKLLGRSKEQTPYIFEVSDSYRKKIIKVLRVAFLSSAVLELFAAASIALIAVYLGMGFLNTGLEHKLFWNLDGVTLQGALFILLLAPEFFLPLRELGTHYHAKSEAIGASIELKNILDKKLNKEDKEKNKVLKNNKKVDILFKNVSVNYENGSKNILKNINLEIKNGEKFAIIGESGAGKSTIFNALMKLVKVNEGEILINDNNLNNIIEKEWYSYLSWVGQNPTLFFGTIKENLVLAKKNATDDELLKSLNFACLKDDILSLPLKLDSKIGEQGLGFSGGQSQRLALARCYLKNSNILLLDEPTSSLDYDFRVKVLENLEKFWDKKTVIVLTHHKQILEKVDRVIIINNGEIIENDKFENLKKNNEYIKHMLLE